MDEERKAIPLKKTQQKNLQMLLQTMAENRVFKIVEAYWWMLVGMSLKTKRIDVRKGEKKIKKMLGRKLNNRFCHLLGSFLNKRKKKL